MRRYFGGGVMNLISVSADRDYEVVIDIDWQKALEPNLVNRGQVAVIVSEAMRDRIIGLPETEAQIHIFTVPDSEAGKSFATYQKVLDWLGAAGFTRNDLIVAVGGGAVTDLSGFVASSWLRGIDWVAVPTTLAAMVDAAVGGKTGINSEYGKNLIGSFYSPISVLVDLSWLETLSDRDFAAGLAEVLKSGFIVDGQIVELLKGKELAEIRADAALTLELISRTVAVKAKVVSGDFKESFDREILNYGHTLGHAIELHSKYALRHGECVSIGLVFAANLAKQIGSLSDEVTSLHQEILRNLGLPVTYESRHWPELRANMTIDKKSRSGTLRFVAISEIGKTLRIEGPSESDLLAAYERLSS
jgi:3-dehydroquinate synthase